MAGRTPQTGASHSLRRSPDLLHREYGVSWKDWVIVPLILLPPDDRRDSAHPRRNGTTRDVLIGFIVACLCIAGVAGLAVATGLLQKQPAQVQTILAPVGHTYTINDLSVTLTSASATPTTGDEQATPPALTTPTAPSVSLTLHFVNQTAQNQTVSIADWQLLDGAGNVLPLITATKLPATLAPNAALDVQCSAPIFVGGSGPFTLQTPTQGSAVILAWQFSG